MNIIKQQTKHVYSFSDFHGFTGIAKWKQLATAQNFLSILSITRQGGYLQEEFESLLLRFGYVSKIANECKVVEYNPDEALEKWSKILWQ